jgi:chromosome condensin MukBEF complex kleisin-like MukF subunit
MTKETFATAINCMDGRTQEPIIYWAKKTLEVDYVDAITEPGPDKILAEGSDTLVESIKNRVMISVNKHGSQNVIVVSHHDCAGNPVSKKEHLEQLKKSVDVISSWELGVKIIGVWIGKDRKVNKLIEQI